MKSSATPAMILLLAACGPPQPPASPADPDGDGVVGDEDGCPSEAEVQNGYKDDDGCPDVVDTWPVEDLVIQEKIYFDQDDWKIKPVSFEVLQGVADLLVQVPQITLVRITGHRDASEPDDMGAELSTKRADSVFKFLVEKGVDPARLEVEGAGDSQPSDPDPDHDQAVLNRRVTFEILETSD